MLHMLHVTYTNTHAHTRTRAQPDFLALRVATCRTCSGLFLLCCVFLTIWSIFTTMKTREYKKIAVADLVTYDRNARTHSAEQIRQLCRSIEEFGFTNPVLVDEQSRVIAGHGRIEAAAALGLSEVPCIVVDGLSDVQRRALILADNKLALNAGWDQDMLISELAELKLAGFDMDLTGFSLEELGDFFSNYPAERDPDDAPPLPIEPITKPGDIWQLGPHRVICGDSTNATHLMDLCEGALVDCVWTDPPYNVAYETKAGKIDNDNLGDAEFRQFLTDAFTSMWSVMKKGAAVYVAHADREGLNFRAAFKHAGFKLSGCLIWRKDSLVFGQSDYQWQHETVLYGWKPGSGHRWFGGRKQTTIVELGDQSPFLDMGDGRFEVTIGNQKMIVSGDASIQELVPTVLFEPKPKRSADHQTMKPVALIERMLKHSARPHDLVLDPFGGSGSTLIAADRLGMSARLCELSPAYCDVIVRRWEDFTGRKAERVRIS